MLGVILSSEINGSTVHINSTFELALSNPSHVCNESVELVDRVFILIPFSVAPHTNTKWDIPKYNQRIKARPQALCSHKHATVLFQLT